MTFKGKERKGKEMCGGGEWYAAAGEHKFRMERARSGWDGEEYQE
jgi:hypothetical protein